MILIIAIVCLMLVSGFFIKDRMTTGVRERVSYTPFFVLAFVSLLLKIFLSGVYYGHYTDMDCFWGWSEMVRDVGFGGFYEMEAFTDYPPGYMYVLYLLGTLKGVFNIDSGVYAVILKLPAVLCDIATGFLLYKTASERFSEKSSLLISGIYMLNPAIVVNSSLWGQVDSVYTLWLALVLLFLCDKKLILAFLAFSISVFIKPQSLIITPVLLFSAAEYVFSEFSGRKLLKVVLGGIGALIFMLLLALPFGIENVLKQYIETIASYPYMTVNAFNVWGALGLNWYGITPYFSILGYVFIAVITVFSAWVFFHNKGKSRYFMTAAFLVFSTFMLSLKMHDRYAFPVILMLIFAYIFSERKQLFNAFWLVSVSQFFNASWILFIYQQDINYYAKSIVVVIASVINIFLFIYTLIILSDLRISMVANIEKRSRRLARNDYLIILGITLVYSVFAFCNLGDMKAPKTSIELENGKTAELELYNEESITNLYYYLGADAVEDDLTVSYYNENGDVVLTVNSESGDAFYWNNVEGEALAKRIIISSEKRSVELFEVVLKNDNGIIPVKSSNFEVLTDEQQLLPERVSYKNSTYFDEIYHARTAYEFVWGKDIYEWTHPPLGKILIALGIKVFGMTPFGWRIVGTLFGVLMIFVIYKLSKIIFRESFISTVCCVMLTFDFMHFTQSRIATIDVYVTFFIMFMYLFMYKYYTLDFNKVSLRQSFKPLLFAGVSFGLGVSVKWTAIYACAGLAVIFFITMFKKIKGKDVFIKTALFCVLAFIVIPVIIYCLSYIPYMNSQNDFSIGAIIENQKEMFTYHGKTVVSSTHPYSSKWYSWPIIYKPMWYYEGKVTETVKEGISAFGNPAVWWLGIPSFVACLYFAFLKRSKKALFLLIGYISCLIPWVFVERTTYIYHYFPCVVFSVLMTGFCICRLEFKYKRYVGTGIMISVVILFLLFYPVLSGASVEVGYVDRVLRWFGSWVLI